MQLPEKKIEVRLNNFGFRTVVQMNVSESIIYSPRPMNTMMIQIMRPDGKTGAVMSESLYSSVRGFILNNLEQYEQLSTSELISLAKEDNLLRVVPEIGFAIIQVKMDLLAKNAIRQFLISTARRKRPVFALNKKHRARFIL